VCQLFIIFHLRARWPWLIYCMWYSPDSFSNLLCDSGFGQDRWCSASISPPYLTYPAWFPDQKKKRWEREDGRIQFLGVGEWPEISFTSALCRDPPRNAGHKGGHHQINGLGPDATVPDVRLLMKKRDTTFVTTKWLVNGWSTICSGLGKKSGSCLAHSAKSKFPLSNNGQREWAIRPAVPVPGELPSPGNVAFAGSTGASRAGRRSEEARKLHYSVPSFWDCVSQRPGGFGRSRAVPTTVQFPSPHAEEQRFASGRKSVEGQRTEHTHCNFQSYLGRTEHCEQVNSIHVLSPSLSVLYTVSSTYKHDRKPVILA
jgi:hypothetical protein